MSSFDWQRLVDGQLQLWGIVLAVGSGASCQFLAGHSGNGCEQKCMVVTDNPYTVQYQLEGRPL